MEKKIEDLVWWHDFESGQSIQISRKTYDAIEASRKEIQDMIYKMLIKNGKINGTIQIVSTMADDNNKSDDFKNIWQEWQNKNNA